MKRIIALVIILTTFTLALASCGGPGGDTNMHKIMQAMYKDEVISTDYLNHNPDSFVYQTADQVERTENGQFANQDYKYVSASATSGYYKHYVNFYISSTVFVKDTHYKHQQATLQWRAEENTMVVKYSGYEYQPWNVEKQRWGESIYLAAVGEISYDMNVYYENGKFETTDATATFDEDKDRIESLGMADQIVQDCTSFLNEALDGLDKVYAEKGYPIK